MVQPSSSEIVGSIPTTSKVCAGSLTMENFPGKGLFYEHNILIYVLRAGMGDI